MAARIRDGPAGLGHLIWCRLKAVFVLVVDAGEIALSTRIGMARIEEQTVIAAPAEEVFDFRLDFKSNLAACNPSVREVVQVAGDGPGGGSRYRVRVRLAPGFTTEASLTVTDAERATRVADLAEAFVDARETVRFEPCVLPDGRACTEVRFVVDTIPTGVLRRVLDALVLPALTRRQVRTELRRMRAELDSRSRR
jgi:uncharacterized membrane protein